MKHRLAVLENAFDSLNEGLRKYRVGKKKSEVGAYKFAVQHIAHFMELYFKAQVTKRHPLLIYKNPFAKDVHQSFTITWREALQFLENDGVSLPATLRADLKWFRDLRNNIEHSAFTLDAKEVRQAIGRLIRGTEEFAESQGLPSIRDDVASDNQATYDVLADEYSQDVDEARLKVREEGKRGEQCGLCWVEGVAVDTGSGMECYFCEELDKYLFCGQCNREQVKSAMHSWNEDVVPPEFLCDGCHRAIMDIIARA